MGSNAHQHATRGNPGALAYRAQIEQQLHAIFVEPSRDISVSLEINHHPSFGAGDALGEGEVHNPSTVRLSARDTRFDARHQGALAPKLGASPRGGLHQRAA